MLPFPGQDVVDAEGVVGVTRGPLADVDDSGGRDQGGRRVPVDTGPAGLEVAGRVHVGAGVLAHREPPEGVAVPFPLGHHSELNRRIARSQGDARFDDVAGVDHPRVGNGFHQ